MHLIKYFILLMTVLLLSACSTKPKEIIVVEYEYIQIELPTNLTISCSPKKPMDEHMYRNLTPNERTHYLASYIKELLGELKKCDNKVKGIKKYVDNVNSNMSDLTKG